MNNTTIVPRFIINLFKQEIEKVHKLLLYEISKDYNLSFDELEKKYISKVDISHDNIQIIKKRDYNLNLKIEDRCCAYNAKNEQCKRSKADNDKYCPIHITKRKNGSIHDHIKDKKWEKLY